MYIILCAQDPENEGVKISERASREENRGRKNVGKGWTHQRKEAQKNRRTRRKCKTVVLAIQRQKLFREKT